jgi:hypothetical protein
MDKWKRSAFCLRIGALRQLSRTNGNRFDRNAQQHTEMADQNKYSWPARAEDPLALSFAVWSRVPPLKETRLSGTGNDPIALIT